MKKFSSILLVAISVVLFASCGKKDKAVEVSVDEAPGARLLAYVPADTPYIFASLAPYPETFTKKIEPLANQVGEMMREATGVLRNMSEDGDSEELVRAFALVYEMTRSERMKEFGMSYGSPTVIYGNGILPVIRTILEKPDRFAPRFKALAAELKLDFEDARAGSLDYQSVMIGDRGARLLVAQDGDMLVLALSSEDFDASDVAVLLGDTKPSASLVGSSKLTALAQKYSYLSQGLGYIDVQGIANIFLDGPKGLNAAIFDNRNPADGYPPICRSEVKTLTTVMPRFAFGYTAVAGDRFVFHSTVELREDIAAALRPVAGVVPGLGEPGTGLVKFGIGVDLKGLRGFIEDKVSGVVENPYECHVLRGLNDMAQQALQSTQQPVPPLAYNFKGFFVDVDSVEGVDFENPGVPEKMDMSFLLAFDNVDGLLQMGQMFLPPLAMLEMTGDGKAVQLPQDMLQGYGAPTFAAMTDDLLTISTGENAKNNAESLASQAVGGEPMLMAISMDLSAYIAIIADMQKSAYADEGFVDDEVVSGRDAASAKRLMEQNQKLLKVYGDVLDRENVTFVITENGLEMPAEITFK